MLFKQYKTIWQYFSLSLLVCLPAFAQNNLEEVVVSASFRDSALHDTPASITIIGLKAIQERGAQHLDEVLGSVANVNFAGGASRSKFIQVRGIGDIEQFKDPKHYPSIGLMIDDLDMSNLGTAGTLFDIEQVEILKGPQGTRFGSAALGGMIKLKSTAPGDTLEGKIVTGISAYSGWELGTAIGGPLGDTLRGRLAVHRFKSDGYKDNTYLEKDDTSSFDEQVLRARLNWQATENSRFDLNIFDIDVDNGYDAFSLNNTRFKSQSDQPGKDRQDTLAIALSNHYQLNDQLLLETTFTTKDIELEYSFDEDWNNTQLCGVFVCPYGDFQSIDFYRRDRDEASLDIRLLSQKSLDGAGYWRWLLGFYHQQRQEKLQQGLASPFFSHYEIDRTAIYGQVEAQLHHRLVLSLGMRVESFEDDYRDNNPTRLNSDNNLWAGELSLNYELSDSSQIYATVSRGYKAGGVNTDANSNFPLLSPLFQDHIGSRLGFNEENLINWELGVKSLELGNGLSVNVALFYMNRSDAQLETWLYDSPSFSWVGYLGNADAITYGIELESSFQVNEALRLFANIGLLKTKLDTLTVFDLDLAQFKNLEDRSVARAPEYQYSIGGNIRLSQRLSLHISLEGRDDYYYAYYHQSKAESSNLLNASLSYTADNWQLTLWGRNLSNQDHKIHGLYFGADPRDGWSTNRSYVQYGEPRVWGLRVSYNF